MKSRFLVLASLPFIVSACAVGTQTLTKDIQTADTLSNESILVIGLQQRYRVHIISGTRSDGGWASDETPMSSAVVVNTFPEEGFIIARVPGTTGSKVYGLTAVMPDGIGLGATHFKACAGNVTPVFEAPAGKVVYVGELDVSYGGGSAHVQKGAAENLGEVKKKLGQRFPAIAAAVLPEPMRMERLTKALCASPTIPVVVPGR